MSDKLKDYKMDNFNKYVARSIALICAATLFWGVLGVHKQVVLESKEVSDRVNEHGYWNHRDTIDNGSVKEIRIYSRHVDIPPIAEIEYSSPEFQNSSLPKIFVYWGKSTNQFGKSGQSFIPLDRYLTQTIRQKADLEKKSIDEATKSSESNLVHSLSKTMGGK